MSSFDTSPTVCPLTKETLPESPLEQAVVFCTPIPCSKIKNCGHVFTMEALVDFLEENSKGAKCPKCQTLHVISVCDASAATQLYNDGDASCENVIGVRYGPQVYWLTVSDGTLAQDRISQVLGMNDLQVLHHGKTVFPDESKTEDEASKFLMEKSERGKKPTLVIMGKRTGRWGAQGGHVHR